MPRSVTARDVKAWLSDGEELAFLDVREHGQYGEAHPFFVIPLPYSVFEQRLAQLVPNPRVRMVLVDEGDGVAERAAAQAEAMGYGNVHIMSGGAPAWAEAGYTLYAGVNVPSKTFGELLELARHTPRLTAEQVRELQAAESDHVIIDGRPYSEYNKFSIPGGICCPNGELALRIRDLVPSEETTIVVNCAGRTRSILGAQTLIDAGVRNPVYALENGTQGWFLAGFQVDRGASRKYSDQVSDADLAARRKTVRAVAEQSGVRFMGPAQAADIIADAARTSYLLDVRTADEHRADGIPGSIHAPGGQLVQTTDLWVGVRGGRILLLDDDAIRAPMAANWLCQLGHEAIVIEGGVAAARAAGLAPVRHAVTTGAGPDIGTVKAARLNPRDVQLVDLRPSMEYREAHIESARFGIRPRLAGLGLDTSRPVVLSGERAVVELAAKDLTAAGHRDIHRLEGDVADWRAAGLEIVSSEDDPADAECIDFLFFTSERHNGNEAASRQYLEWEIGLVDQLDDQERGSFRIAQP
jgi:rhodanese-related sulfurtransferase